MIRQKLVTTKMDIDTAMARRSASPSLMPEATKKIAQLFHHVRSERQADERIDENVVRARDRPHTRHDKIVFGAGGKLATSLRASRRALYEGDESHGLRAG
jgi:hypothetical protein